MNRLPPQTLHELQRKAVADAFKVAQVTMGLAEHPEDKREIATAVATMVCSMAAGLAVDSTGCTPEEATSDLLDFVQAVTVLAVAGRDLLANRT